MKPNKSMPSRAARIIGHPLFVVILIVAIVSIINFVSSTSISNYSDSSDSSENTVSTSSASGFSPSVADTSSANGGDIRANTEETEHVHSPVPIPDAEPTCDKDGHTGGSKCSACGFILSSPTVVEKLGHTCTDGICERCGNSVLAGMTVQPSAPPKVSSAGQVARRDFEQAIKEWPELKEYSAYALLNIYNAIETEFSASPSASDDEVLSKVSKKFSTTKDDAFLAYGFVGMNYETVRSAAGYDTANPDNLKPKFGKLSKAEAFGSTLDITVKIDWILSGSSTVNQNYFNVCDMIQNQGADAYTTINYTAIMSTTDGGTTTVVFFVVSKSAIDLIKAGNFPEITLSDYVDDLWIHPQLKE